MKLYYSPGSCSLASHIIAREAGHTFELCRVDLGTKQTELGTALSWVHPKGYVPLLEFAPGEVLPVAGVSTAHGWVLSEGPAILQLLADSRPEAGLIPAAGNLERYRVQEWLTYIGTELHKGFSLLFKRSTAEADKDEIRAKLMLRLSVVEDSLRGRNYLMGSAFSVADAYLFTVLRWARPARVSLANVLTTYAERIATRPAVQAALAAEGLRR